MTQRSQANLALTLVGVLTPPLPSPVTLPFFLEGNFAAAFVGDKTSTALASVVDTFPAAIRGDLLVACLLTLPSFKSAMIFLVKKGLRTKMKHVTDGDCIKNVAVKS